MIVGFLFAAYAVVGNDAIQTLGTFLSSNGKRPWWVLWLYASGIALAVLAYGWATEGGDVSYGRLEKVPVPEVLEWWFVLPPLVLLIITRYGIPVSTTFLILSVFSLADSEGLSALEIVQGVFSTDAFIGKMLLKSVSGYIVAFLAAFLIYLLISRLIERYFIDTYKGELPGIGWVALQWISTGFLWSQWLIQDMANIFVYLPRPLNFSYFLFSAVVFVALQGFIFYNRGGEIQKIVTTKTNTTDIRSATIVDFIYGIILLIFKEWSKIPMSTTWVFVGLLAGREFSINLLLRRQSISAVARVVTSDFIKIMIGLAVSILLMVLISFLR